MIKVGDWVRQYHAGIWRVSRIVQGFNESRWRLSDPVVRSSQTYVVMNRLLNASGKRSFGTDSCHDSFVKPLSAAEAQQVTRTLNGHPKLRQAFERYEANPKAEPQIVNLSLQLDSKEIRRRFDKECGIRLATLANKDGMILDQVLQQIYEAGFEKALHATPSNTTLQLIGRDHELRGADFVLREYRVLDF